VPIATPARPIRVRGALIALAAILAFAWRPGSAVGDAAIESSGPLRAIFLGGDLACQVRADGDRGPSFFDDGKAGACGTFLAVANAEGVSARKGIHLYGPSLPNATRPERDFVPSGGVSQSGTGSGTEADPFVVTTHVEAIEEEEAKGAPGEQFPAVQMTETDSYVVGRERYDTKLRITNLTAAKLVGTVYHAGDCQLSGMDAGFGAANLPLSGSAACTAEPENSPAGRFMAFSPLPAVGKRIEAPSFVEGSSFDVWSDINGEALPFPDTIDATTEQDNGIGLSWPINLKAAPKRGAEGETVSLSFTTTVSPVIAPTSSASAGVCVSGGAIPVTVSAAGGAAGVEYLLDGASGFAVADASGQATIPVGEGQHTLEYWAEDLAGVQEVPHRLLTFTAAAAAAGPALTIVSDQGQSVYEVDEPATVTVAAGETGLTSDPSAAGVPISTAGPGKFSVTRSAASACGVSTATFDYTVIPQPVLGRTANVRLVSGRASVAPPRAAPTNVARASRTRARADTPSRSGAAPAGRPNTGRRFTALTGIRQVPVGSILDTASGVVRVTTATAIKGKLQFGEFAAGLFTLRQRRAQQGLAEVDLTDVRGAHAACATRGRGEAARKPGALLGRLKVDAHGHFVARGRYGTATVRSAVLELRDRCDGTLVHVTSGAARIRDFAAHRTITLFGGESYLARAPLTPRGRHRTI
jgi:hypothetical protein